jgi:hypothetical protein
MTGLAMLSDIVLASAFAALVAIVATERPRRWRPNPIDRDILIASLVEAANGPQLPQSTMRAGGGDDHSR